MVIVNLMGCCVFKFVSCFLICIVYCFLGFESEIGGEEINFWRCLGFMWEVDWLE